MAEGLLMELEKCLGVILTKKTLIVHAGLIKSFK